MAVPYHTHDFEIPIATKDDVVAGVSNNKALTPASVGNAAARNVEDFATAEQGAKASTAVQPADLAQVATSGDYNDLNNRPALGSVASRDITEIATAAQGALADTAVQPHDIGTAAAHDEADFASADQGATADSALQAPGGSAGQVLTKSGNGDNEVEWKSVASATAVSYGPQELVDAEKKQVRDNIGIASGFSTAGELIVTASDDESGYVSLTPGDNTHTGYIGGYLPNKKRSWYFGWGVENGYVTIGLENGTKGVSVVGGGFDISSGLLTAHLGAMFSSGTSSTQSYPIQMGWTGAAYAHWRWVLEPSASGSGITLSNFNAQSGAYNKTAMTINYDGAANFPISIVSAYIESRGNVKANNALVCGQSYMDSSGNINGSAWDGPLSSYIEGRCAAFADDRKNGSVTDTRIAGWIEWAYSDVTLNQWNQVSGYVLTAFMKGGAGNITTSHFAARQPQVLIPYVGWRVLGPY
ncbi:hypothetical protein ACWF50_13100 [Brucella pseudogrignonensis]